MIERSVTLGKPTSSKPVTQCPPAVIC